jgi:hypothetical protein
LAFRADHVHRYVDFGRLRVSRVPAIFALLSKLTAAWSRRPHPGRTADRTYLVYLRAPSPAVQRVVASRFEIHEEHLVFVDREGKLVALFVMELVESFNVVSG